jgi:hypothetical protein
MASATLTKPPMLTPSATTLTTIFFSADAVDDPAVGFGDPFVSYWRQGFFLRRRV